MKKNLKQAFVPLAVMVFGAAAAFATNAVKSNEKTDEAAVIGYYYDHNETVLNKCKPIVVECGIDINVICTDLSQGQVWRYGTETLTGCTDLLYMNF